MEKFNQARMMTAQDTADGKVNQDAVASNDIQAAVRGMANSTLDALRSMAQRIDEVMPGTMREAGENVRDAVDKIVGTAKQAVPGHGGRLFEKIAGTLDKKR